MQIYVLFAGHDHCRQGVLRREYVVESTPKRQYEAEDVGTGGTFGIRGEALR